MALPRLLAVMGSGETAPTMVKVHRRLLEEMGPAPVPAVLVDTPFAFQENAKEIAGRAVRYFAESLHAPISVTGLSDPSSSGTDDGATERLVAQVRQARYVFAGPGSPSYALRKWRVTVVPDLLAEKLLHGGCVVFASAAALTLGLATVPVYEIYKCGEDPHWLEGLDLTASIGLRAVVIPHYDNAEGGTHDTRFCYLGERRLSAMEQGLPEDAFVLGVDEHTACVFDIGAGTVSVEGRGVLTIRKSGHSATFPSGATVALDALVETAERLGGAGEAPTAPLFDASGQEPGAAAGGSPAHADTSPLVEIVRDRENEFSGAVARRDMSSATKAILELESDVSQWSTDIPPGDELERAHASLRSLIFELGRLSRVGAADPRDRLAPFVAALLEVRDTARQQGRYEEADAVRARLAEAGIEVRDTTEGSEWRLSDDEGGEARSLG